MQNDQSPKLQNNRQTILKLLCVHRAEDACKDRKFNHTSQINFAPLPLSNSIFVVKTMTDSAPRLLPWQELVAPTPKIGAR